MLEHRFLQLVHSKKRRVALTPFWSWPRSLQFLLNRLRRVLHYNGAGVGRCVCLGAKGGGGMAARAAEGGVRQLLEIHVSYVERTKPNPTLRAFLPSFFF